MKRSDKILIYVPARGGSKGIVNKNIKELNGKPLICYTLDIVRQLQKTFLDKVAPFVSSDSEMILEKVATYGIDVDYRRPPWLSGDKSTIVDGIFHALDWLASEKAIVPEIILLLQPTSPFRKISDAERLINIFCSSKVSSMFSVIPMKQHPYECISIEEGGWNYLRLPISKNAQRQFYKDDFYFIDGGYYIVTVDFLRRFKNFVVKGESEPFFVDNKFAIDIDEPEDLLMADTLMKFRNNE